MGFNPQGQWKGFGPNSGNPWTPQFKNTPAAAPYTPPPGPTREQEGEGRIDTSREDQLSAIDAALKAFRGDPDTGDLSFVDRIKAAMQPGIDSANSAAPGISGQIKAGRDTAKKGVDDATVRRDQMLGEAKKGFSDIWNSWRDSISTARKDWEAIRTEYKDTSALQSQRAVHGLRESAKQSAGQLRAQAEAVGIPRDQIDAQVRQMMMDTNFEAGRYIGETAARTNDKIAEINTTQSQILAGLEGQGLGAAVGAFGQVMDTNIQSALQVLQSERTLVETEVGAANQELELSKWVTGVRQTADGIVANGELMSAQAVQALEALRAQIEMGNVDAWMQWQETIASFGSWANNIDATFQV